MSSYLAGSGDELFGSGGGEVLSREVEAPLLGRIPFDPRLGARSDEGEATVETDPETEVSQAIVALAGAIASTKREQGSRHPEAPSARLGLNAYDRLRGLGFSEADARTLADHFEEADRRNRPGHGTSRLDWLAESPDLDPTAAPQRAVVEHGYERGRKTARSAISFWRGSSSRSSSTRLPAHASSSPRNAFRTATSATGWGSLAAKGLVAALTATSPPRLAHPGRGRAAGRHEPPRHCRAELRRAPPGRGRVHGEGDLWGRPRGRGSARGARPVRRRAGTQGLRSRRRAAHARLVPRRGKSTARSCSSRGPNTTPCPACGPRAGGVRLPGDG